MDRRQADLIQQLKLFMERVVLAPNLWPRESAP